MTDAIRQAIADIEYIVNREDYTFAECSEAEEFVSRAKSALASLRAIGDVDRVRAEAMREQRESISDELSAALQSDLEHGVRWLNEKAAAEFQTKYPSLSKALSAAIAQQEQEGTK